MGLVRYKTLKEARREDMRSFIEQNVKESFFKVLGKEISKSTSLYHHPYKTGLYRFKSLEDARRFDLEVTIKNSFRRNRRNLHDKS